MMVYETSHDFRSVVEVKDLSAAVNQQVGECGNGLRALRIGSALNPALEPGSTLMAFVAGSDTGTSGDLIHDPDDLPYPFPDDHFDEVIGTYLIERVHDPMAVMAELHRITRPGGHVKLTSLHWTNPEFASDLRNRNHLSSYSLRNLTLDRVVYPFYTDVRFNQIAARVTMPRPWKFLGWELLINLDIRYPGLRFFRRMLEHYLNCVVRARETHFELEVIKK
jgi:SAM-dependent methyltransferase